MFTGLISDVGRIAAVQPVAGGIRLRVETGYDLAGMDIGASVAHAGVCLTVTAKAAPGTGNWYEVEAWEEALAVSTIGSWKAGDRVNLERSLKLGDELGGHLVQGHVDGTAEIAEVTDTGEARRFVLEAPAPLARFIAPKGSVALDGTSLTVNGVVANRFDVLLIRHTLAVTTWGARQAGNRVNIEVDQMARYAARLIEAR
ncbi:MAG: riboflavin synthase [Rhodobiaceae bacterium]|nr:riboflavin synthase [Rhodobiaceae bacterium]